MALDKGVVQGYCAAAVDGRPQIIVGEQARDSGSEQDALHENLMMRLMVIELI